jgi:hypothetical protein
MKIIFAGPSLFGASKIVDPSIEFRGPAFHGGVYDAVSDGANVIGIVDGFFESVSSVWHKEILHALSCGVTMFGAASMGALRAVECMNFGMIGVGEIFAAYRDGSIIDDDAVALIHAPREVGYMPLTVPLVNVIWTLAAWREQDLISSEEQDHLMKAAQSLFFKDRTWRDIIGLTAVPPDRATTILALAKSASVDRKALDAQMLVERVQVTENTRGAPPSWNFSHTDQFERFVVGSRANAGASVTPV